MDRVFRAQRTVFSTSAADSQYTIARGCVPSKRLSTSTLSRPYDGARRSDDRPLDVARELAERASRRFQPEAGEDAEGARSQRDTRCPLEEFASVDGSTLRREFSDA